jgi:cyclic pyranopterin phosphate synthase
MIDQYKRDINYIRISVTDRCNLGCVYCMPKEGAIFLPQSEILTNEEIIRLCRCFAKLGMKHLKITGGEPLVRNDIVSLVGKIKSLEGISRVTLTTNGVLLMEHLSGLLSSGLDGVNISLDTLDPDRYKQITRRDCFNQVRTAVKEAVKYSKLKVKINCVPMADTSEKDIRDLVELARGNPLSIRFIEMMPIGLGKNYSFRNEEELRSLITLAYGELIPIPATGVGGPARYYSLPGFLGTIGFISAMSHKFCNECNRIRLTADGHLKTCLQYEKGWDLKSMLRHKTTDSILERAIALGIYGKPGGHSFHSSQCSGFHEQEYMSQIGG